MRFKVKLPFFLGTVIIIMAGVVLFLLSNNVRGENKTMIKEAKIDFVYVYGDEDSAVFRIILTKKGEKIQIEYMKCPLQEELFRDGRWVYAKGIIPVQETEYFFEQIPVTRLNVLKDSYKWQGTTANHPALLKIYFRLGNNQEFKKDIQINNYPSDMKNVPLALKEIVEVTDLLQSQMLYASEKLYDDLGKKELIRNVDEISHTVSGELKYFSSLAADLVRRNNGITR